MNYKIYDINFVLSDETQWLKTDKDRNLVTLLSCEPYMINTHRILVKGELTSIKKVKNVEDETGLSIKTKIIIFIIIVLLVLIIITIMVFKKQSRDGIK